jgi:hypothetical protein
MGTVGCYTLDVYCDAPSRGEHKCTAWPGQFTGNNEAACKREARRRGWRFGRAGGYEGAGNATCPKHTSRPRGDR